jgi:hypothetical protein
MDTKKPASTARKNLGDFAPKLVELTEEVLFGDVWERPQRHVGHDPRQGDLKLPLEQVAEGYRAMHERRAIKALLRPAEVIVAERRIGDRLDDRRSGQGAIGPTSASPSSPQRAIWEDTSSAPTSGLSRGRPSMSSVT